MTSRERILCTLRHEEPDKVPIDLGAMRSTGIMAIAYNQLKRFLGVKDGSTRVYDVYQQLAEPELDILKRFGVDVIDLDHSLGLHPEQWKSWRLPDGSLCEMPVNQYPVRQKNEWVFFHKSKVVGRMPDGCLYFESCNPPLADAKSKQDILNYDWYYYTDEELRTLEEKSKWLHKHTDFAIMGGFGGNILESGQSLRGWDTFMMDLMINRSFAEDLMDKLIEVHLVNLKKYLQAVGDYIQIIQMGDDLGTQHSPQLSPDLYRELIKPRHSRIYQYVKQHSDLFVFLHSCGSIYALLPDLIDAGVDIINPVQTSAADMEAQRLKREFGDNLVFWGGGADTQTVMPEASPASIREHVMERIHIFAPGGGFVFAPVHNIQANVPPENIVAVYETALEARNYPITV